MLSANPNRFINLHIAYLPFNRGANPNYWSWAEGTPSGVTIHEIDEGIDTGPIIAQSLLALSPENTFKATYAELLEAMEELFVRCWPSIRMGYAARHPQRGSGSFHLSRQLPATFPGWDQRIRDVFPAYAADATATRATIT